MNDEQPLQKVVTARDCAALGLTCDPPATQTSWGALAWEEPDVDGEIVFLPYVADADVYANAAARAAGRPGLRIGSVSRLVIPTSTGAWVGIAALVVVLAGFASTFAGSVPALSGLLVIAFLVLVPVLVPRYLHRLDREHVHLLHANDLVAWRVLERAQAGHDAEHLVAVLRSYATTPMGQDEALALVEQS